MKHKIITFILCGIFVAGLSACTDLLDERKPLMLLSDADVWSNESLVESYVSSCYARIGTGWDEGVPVWLGSVTDEMVYTHAHGGHYPNIDGSMNANDLAGNALGILNVGARSWGSLWYNIAQCNLFLREIGAVTFTDPVRKTQITGEIRFLRALMYHDFMRRWGAMPIITKYLTLADKDEIVNMHRNTYKECVDFLVAECEQAARELPTTFSGADKGRANSVAALALRGRVLLYAASDLMNVNPKDLFTGYAAPADNRWELAARAADSCINVAERSGYALYDEPGTTVDVVTSIYTNLFMKGGNSEILFDRQMPAYGNGPRAMDDIDGSNFPAGYPGNSGNTPSSEMVDDFEMFGGGAFNWNNSAHKAAPYANREGRFYASIVYDGAFLRDREVELFYNVDNSGVLLNTGGKDTQFGLGTTSNVGKTGYHVLKYIDKNYAGEGNIRSSRQWIWLRLGEQYLNAAEAWYRAGNESLARERLNKIRTRARLPLVTASGDALMTAIKHERKIELCFEEHRYFDLRRWKDNATLNAPLTGVTIHRYPDGRKVYHPGKEVESRMFLERMYWVPIPYSEIAKSPSFEQNFGY
jgi:hypothetical protein